MQPELPIAEYKFTYQVQESFTLPACSGTLWHGIFGRALKELVCVTHMDQCDACMFLYQCDYPYLFRGPRPPDSEIMRNYSTIPLPHIFRFDTMSEQSLATDDHFTISMVLVGSANEKLAVIIRAMYAAGINGLGKKRSQCKLIDVSQIGPQQQAIQLMDEGQITNNALPLIPDIPNTPKQLQLKFLTPYKPSGKTKEPQLDIDRFIMAVVRRISLLQYFYTGKQLEADFRQLKESSTSLSIINPELQWQSYQRYSASHGKTIDTSGWLGNCELNLDDNDCLWPYLYLGQYLGAGKNASMGFGRYSIKITDAEV